MLEVNDPTNQTEVHDPAILSHAKAILDACRSPREMQEAVLAAVNRNEVGGASNCSECVIVIRCRGDHCECSNARPLVDRHQRVSSRQAASATRVEDETGAAIAKRGPPIPDRRAASTAPMIRLARLFRGAFITT